MNKCPRCKNEKLREGQKFCQMCGFNLNMNKENAITSLKKLVDENKLLYPSERQAIEYAILELERTAQEVPVQEQSESSITTNVGNTSVVMNKDGVTIKSPEIIIQNQ